MTAGDLAAVFDGRHLEQLLEWAAPFPDRRWAIEGADGLGYLLAQQLLASGETVFNVPATLLQRAQTPIQPSP